jgi:hypothetical protein
MDFSVARPDVVRAINQRWLLKFWKRQSGTHRLPRWQAVEAEDLSRVAANLSFLDVSGSDGTARFLIRFHGATIGRVYGSVDCRGKYLDEVIPSADRMAGLEAYHQTIQTGRPVYTIHDVTDRNGRLVHYERLLLPFSRDGETADRILAAFEFVCPDGAFDHHGLMTTPAAPPQLRLCATIGPQTTV